MIYETNEKYFKVMNKYMLKKITMVTAVGMGLQCRYYQSWTLDYAQNKKSIF